MNTLYNTEEFEIINIRCKELQDKYNFEIPKYILIELIKPIYNRLEVALLINMAIMNDRFTKEEGLMLKKKFCY